MDGTSRIHGSGSPRARVVLQTATLTLDEPFEAAGIERLMAAWPGADGVSVHLSLGVAATPASAAEIAECAGPVLLILAGPGARARLKSTGDGVALYLDRLGRLDAAAEPVVFAAALVGALLHDAAEGTLPGTLFRFPDWVHGSGDGAVDIADPAGARARRRTRLLGRGERGEPIELVLQQVLTILFLYAEERLQRWLAPARMEAFRRIAMGERPLAADLAAGSEFDPAAPLVPPRPRPRDTDVVRKPRPEPEAEPEPEPEVEPEPEAEPEPEPEAEPEAQPEPEPEPECAAVVGFVRGVREMQNRYYEGPVPEGTVVPTSFQHTVDALALGLMAVRAEPPAERDLIKVVVSGDVEPDATVTLRTPFAVLSGLRLVPDGDGYITREWIVLVSGTNPAGLQPAPGVRSIYVGTVADISGGLDVDAVVIEDGRVCGRGRLNVTEILTPSGGLRIQRYATIAERTPVIRVVLPEGLGLADVTVWLDYGDPDILEEIDITPYFQAIGGRAFQADAIPRSLPRARIAGNFSREGEDLHFRQEPADLPDGELYFFRTGENRIRIVGPGGELLEEGHALHYERDDITVVARFYGRDPLPGPPIASTSLSAAALPSGSHGRYRVVLFFQPLDMSRPAPADIGDISTFGYSFYARQQGLTPDLRIVEVRPRLDLSTTTLLIYQDAMDTRHPSLVARAQLETAIGTPGLVAFGNLSPTIRAGIAAAASARHSHHMVYGSYAARRLGEVVAPAAGAPIQAAFVDTGFANSDGTTLDLSATRAAPTAFMVNGGRLVRPVTVDPGGGAVFAANGDGDLRLIPDTFGANGHGTQATVVFCGDGVGTGAAVGAVALGVARDASVRMVRWVPATQSEAMIRRCLEIIRDDPAVLLCVIEYWWQFLGAADLAARAMRYQQITAGAADRRPDRILVAPAGNSGGGITAASLDAGVHGGNRNNARSTYADEWRRRVIIVGGSTRVDNPGTAAAEVHRPPASTGQEICVVAPAEGIAAVDRTSAAILFTDTSTANPQAAGLLAELLRIDANLRTGEGLIRAIEYVEATAVALHAAAGLRDNNTGFGRIDAFAAALAVINGGLPAEGHNPDAAGARDTFFTYLPIVAPNAVRWYGFEVRSFVQNAVVYLFDRTNNRWERLQDAAADVPPFTPPGGGAAIPGVVHCFFRTLPYRNPAGRRLPAKLVNPGIAAGVDPANPSPDVWFCRFAVRKQDLDGATRFGLFAPADDPNAAGTDPLIQFPIDLVDMRRKAAGAATNRDIERYVEHFDDHVFAVAMRAGLDVVRVTAPAQMLAGAAHPVTVSVRANTTVPVMAVVVTPRFLDASGAVLATFASVPDPANPAVIAAGAEASFSFQVTPNAGTPVGRPVTIHAAAAGTRGGVPVSDPDSLALIPAVTVIAGIRAEVDPATVTVGSAVRTIGRVLDAAGRTLPSGVQAAARTLDPAIATAAVPNPIGSGLVLIDVTGVALGNTTLEFTATVGGNAYMATSRVEVVDFNVAVDPATVVAGSDVIVGGRVTDAATGRTLASGVSAAVETADPAIATAAIPNPSGSGLILIAVTGVAAGATTLTLSVTVGGTTKQATSAITVGDFAVSVDPVTVAAGAEATTLGFVRDAQGQTLRSGVTVTAVTADAAIATAAIPNPSGSGLALIRVRGLAPGSTTLTFTATVGTRSKPAAATVTVTDFQVSVQGATVAPGSTTTSLGEVRDDAGRALSSGVQAAVATADPSIATAAIPNPSASGLQIIEVRGVSTGSTTLTFTATVGGRSKQATATILVDDFSVTIDNVTVARGSSRGALMRVTDSRGQTLASGVTAALSTGNPAIATAGGGATGGSGLILFRVQGVAIGGTTVRGEATVGGRTKAATATVTVTDHSISLQPATVAAGSTVTVIARVMDGAGSALEDGVTPSAVIADPAVATAAVAGASGIQLITVAGVAPGPTTLTFTATVGGVARSASVRITVTQ